MKRALGISVFGLALAAVIGVFLGLSASTFTYAEGASYLSNDPRACVNCHIMREQYDAWQKSLHHANAACNDCHVPHDVVGKYMAKAEHGYRHSKAFTFQDFNEPIRITPGDLKIVEANCVRCHSRMVEEVTAHAEATSCVHCHKGIGHGPSR